ncbi:MAG: polysaccharide deacetylase [Actinobacteria bacterium]|nr:polysaccharide deacetylase [Actinomycetota bacterium]
MPADSVTTDWMTGLPRSRVEVAIWPGGARVAVAFVLYVEQWGFGHGPNLRPEMATRNPDFVNESFREYAIRVGLPRISRLFGDLGIPLSLAVSTSYPQTYPALWDQICEASEGASVVAHGVNNSTDQLPLGEGITMQIGYISECLDNLRDVTGNRPIGWSSPSVYCNAETFSASTAAGVRYSLDGMDSDNLWTLDTPNGDLLLIPYPTQAVDMGYYLGRNQQATNLEQMWRDYVAELVREATNNPDTDATCVAIGIHPFVMGTPDGTAALRRLLLEFEDDQHIWLANTDAIYAHVLGQVT